MAGALQEGAWGQTLGLAEGLGEMPFVAESELIGDIGQAVALDQEGLGLEQAQLAEGVCRGRCDAGRTSVYRR